MILKKENGPAKDLHPHSIVENQGFHAMLRTLEPRYNVPSRRYSTQWSQNSTTNRPKPKSWNMFNQYDLIVAFFIFFRVAFFSLTSDINILSTDLQVNPESSVSALHRVHQCSRLEKVKPHCDFPFCLRSFLYENCIWMWYTAKCLLFGLRDSMLRTLFIVRSLGLFIIYLWTRAAFYVVIYSEKNAGVHKHYFCFRAAGTGFYIFEWKQWFWYSKMFWVFLSEEWEFMLVVRNMLKLY